ncbi:hypothetical protein BJ165DRAFT_1408405 [Panaeolus papilionaceus]|nr:hypothetical protein BJ165DRAFT_1408405 [Panaeolus papilionaceus]
MSNIQPSKYADKEPVFPLEIFELIITAVTLSIDQPSYSRSPPCNSPDVISLSLVSRSFANLCRPYLFRSLDIYMERSVDHAKRLAAIIAERPDIANFIHSFSYCDHLIFNRRHAINEDSLDVFLHLPAVTSLKVDGLDSRIDEVSNINLNKLGYQSILQRYITSETLTSLCIRSIDNLPILDIMNCPNLESLSLMHCGYRDWDKPAPPEVLHTGFNITSFNCGGSQYTPFPLLAYCPKLKSISLTRIGHLNPPRTNFPILARPLPSFDYVQSIESRGSLDWTYFCDLADSAGVKAFPALKRLNIELCVPGDVPNGSNAIFSHIDSLEVLLIQGSAVLDPSLLNLRQCFVASARTLEDITIVWTLEPGWDQSLLRGLCDALQAVSGSNVIQDIELRFDIVVEGTRMDPTQFREWTRFDRLLMDDRRATFPKLHGVYITVTLLLTGLVSHADKQHSQDGLVEDYKGHLRASSEQLLTPSEMDVEFTVYMQQN